MENENFQSIKNLQVWYRIAGIGFGTLAFLAVVLFFSVNQQSLGERQYIFLVISTIMYILIPFIVSMALSSATQTPALLEEINKGYNRYRWIEYLFSSSIMIMSLGVLIGVNSFSVLFLFATMMGITILLGSIADWFKNNYFGIIFFGLSTFVFTLLWVNIFRTYIEIRQEPLDVVASSSTFHQLIIMLSFFSFFPVLFVIQHYSGLKLKYTLIDKGHIVFGFVAKCALFFITLMKL